MNKNNPSPFFLTGYLIWILAALFYAYEFVLRVSPSVIVDDLILEFSGFALSKASLGSLSALYFYAYALTQIPAGLLCDRFGTRKLLTFACLLTTFGTLLFASAQNILIADISRIIIGAGSAFAFVSCLKLARNWIPPKQFPLIVGITNAFGMCGAIMGNQPLAGLVLNAGWRQTFYILGLIGLGLSVVLWMFIRNAPGNVNLPRSKVDDLAPIHTPFLKREFWAIFSSQTWLLAFYGCLLVAPVATFGEMWGVSFLQTRFMISKDIASSLIAFIFMGIGIGGPLIGLISTRFPYYRIVMSISTTLAFMALLTILYWNKLSLWEIRGLLFCYGFFTSNMLLCFSLIAFQHSKQTVGAAIGFANMMIMAGGAAFQPLVGKLLDISRVANGISLSAVLPSLLDFRSALWILPACLMLALTLIWFVKPRPITLIESDSPIVS